VLPSVTPLRDNLVLIGMAGAGKSTVGVVLAKRLGMDFVDTDLLIQRRHGARLVELIARHGLEGFLRREEEVVESLRVQQTVIATGGSVVYGAAGMAALAARGRIVFLDVPLAVLEERLHDLESRGLVIEPGESLATLYARRLPLYRQWAEVTVDCGSRPVGEIVTELEQRCG